MCLHEMGVSVAVFSLNTKSDYVEDLAYLTQDI